jgi:type II secretory pathway pseudopilin PulG
MKKPGFTFIEVLVVFSIVALVVPSIFAIIFAVLREQTKILRLSTAKREGDYALNIMGSVIRNRALSIHSDSPTDDTNQVCRKVESVSAGSLYFKDDTGAWFGYYSSSNKISSASSVIATPLVLNSANTYIDNFSIGCERSAAYSYPAVSISFDICYKTQTGNCSSTRPEEISTLHYQSKVSLRNSY